MSLKKVLRTALIISLGNFRKSNIYIFSEITEHVLKKGIKNCFGNSSEIEFE